MTASTLSSLIALGPDVPVMVAAAAPRVVVVGDVVLDGWWHGEVRRLCREAPAPVVDLGARESAPGGAANTALNAARLGGRVSLLSVQGDDAAGDTLRALLESGGVDCSGLVADSDAATTTKSRIVAGDQIIARLDEQGSRPSAEALASLAARLPRALAEADAVVVCDYDLGALDGEVGEVLARVLAGRCPAAPLVVVDAHDPARWRHLNPDLTTPNAGEAARLLGSAPAGDRADAMRAHRADLLERTGARCVVVTLDREGTLALPGDGFTLGTSAPTRTGQAGPDIPEHRTWARPAGERQATGAGDTFVACLAVGLAAGLNAPTALNLAQAASDVVVQRAGTSVCTTDDLRAHLGGLADSVAELDDLERTLDDHRRTGRRIVLTNGCFDVLHRGHTRYLEQARALGDVLVVAINDDAAVRRLKGPDRPVNPVLDRAAVLAALSCVDHVVTFSSDTAVPVIERLRPDVYAKGGDYTPDTLAETPAVEAYGGRVVILDYLPDRSTTAVLHRIRAGAEPAGTPADDAGRRPA
ncbi:MAG TPA: D-glycero-beta-D-manno-heptose 1-phosphate adenylyltransferase [Propionibacteriaceae bacterium]|nr:D-glycero-beta-D-manno-heptose 1-phosphate adenylyltransferase [Propionibacteriaceae bacterium]